MNKIITFIFCIFFTGLFFGENITKENLLQYLNEKQHLNTKFIQTTSKTLNNRKIEGVLKANRTGSFKIVYMEPIKETISADSKFLYKLDLELNQMDVIPREDYFNNTPISLFIKEIDDLNKLYKVDSCLPDAKNLICTILSRDNDSFVEKLFLTFKENQLLSLGYIDTFDQIVNLSFVDVSWKPFDDSELSISVPEGIDVVYH